MKTENKQANFQKQIRSWIKTKGRDYLKKLTGKHPITLTINATQEE